MNNNQYPVFSLIIPPSLTDEVTPEILRCFFSDVYHRARMQKEALFIIARGNKGDAVDYIDCALELRPDNVLIYGLEDDIWFYGVESLNDLAAISAATLRLQKQTILPAGAS
ncbi:hypothetical protein [Erwinia psidii]|uniref:Uncharacterized protein n=1 Tax=Erwinia psidii TaxID=69224 RepID=A0A3N6SNH5_9GAMM|nr:hypothetical protein [Erwinia psidii]MCX8956308.1 hypothetical protein [Erwinia psidii]MCX8959932.1 hypothetical protein [Erwinia psidii]MCX8963478.1 hypothetical protein [Erwinia psidii]RQM39306.1 hypothetical protein EB241_06035 [Erwinia psidii]